MGLFEIWRPKSQEEKPRLPALPGPAEEPRHALPAPGTAPPKKDPFEIFAPKKEPAPPVSPTPSGPRPRSLMEAMVPEVERGAIYRQPAPAPVHAERAPEPVRIQRKSWQLPSPEEFSERLSQIFDLDAIFAKIKRGPTFHGEGYEGISLVPVAPVDDVDLLGDFFGIPHAVIGSYTEVPPEREVTASAQLWDETLWPMFDMTTEAFEILKPRHLLGWFQLGPGAKEPRIIELQYIEGP
jgi:hypothetical protein